MSLGNMYQMIAERYSDNQLEKFRQHGNIMLCLPGVSAFLLADEDMAYQSNRNLIKINIQLKPIMQIQRIHLMKKTAEYKLSPEAMCST